MLLANSVRPSGELLLRRLTTTLHTFVHGIERREAFGFFVVRAALVVANPN